MDNFGYLFMYMKQALESRQIYRVFMYIFS